MAAKILVTGRPGCGKTTVIRRTVELLGAVAGGFTTEEIRERGERQGFRVTDLHSGGQGVLAHVDRHGGPRVGKYGVDVVEFERVGVAALREAIGRGGCVIVDEIGKMELASAAFREAVMKVLESDHPVLGAIAMQGPPFLAEVRRRKDVQVVEATAANRDELPRQLAAVLAVSAVRPHTMACRGAGAVPACGAAGRGPRPRGAR